MRAIRTLLAALLVAAGAGAARAACADDVAALEAKTEAKGRDAIAANSGGQKDAAARGAAAEADKGGTPVAAQPHADAGGGTAASEAAAAAGHGGTDVTDAKVSLNAARVAAGKGDEAGCRAALAKARDAQPAR